MRECRAMTAPTPPPGLQPVPGSARGRGRIIVDLSDHLDRGTRRRAGVFRRALRREASRLRDPASDRRRPPPEPDLRGHPGRPHRSRRGRRRRRARLLGGRPDLAQRRRSVPPDGAVPALRLRPMDAPDVRAMGAPAVGRRVVRVAGRDDPAAALDHPLGVPATAADDRRDHRRPRIPVRREPRHREHQPPAHADAVGRPVHRPATRRPAVGARDLDEMGPGRVPADPARARQAVGPLLARRVGRPEPADPAADDHPAPGAVRVRGATGQARLPRLPVGRRPVVLPQGRTRSTSSDRRPGGAGWRTPGPGSARLAPRSSREPERPRRRRSRSGSRRAAARRPV